ncbi:MAG: ATP-binding protein [Burkholderiales bacterium]
MPVTPSSDALDAPAALRRLVGFRYAIVLLVAIAIVGLRIAFDTEVPWVRVALALAGLAGVNAILHWRIARRGGVSEPGLLANFVLEVAALTALLYFVGGATSPLVSVYLLPLTMAANLLTRRDTWILAVLTAGCYSLLLFAGLPVAEHAHHADAGSTAFGQHLIGMWVVFVVSAALVAHYVSSLAQSVRDRDRRLARAREDALRNERIVALGTLGAGAAHDLGTPLATMNVLAEDMALRHASNAELAGDVQLLQGEIARCKTILDALARAAGSERGEESAAEAADTFLARTVDRWRLLRPTVPAAVQWSGGAPPSLVADRTLEQALHNLLNNAADASPGGFEVQGKAGAGEVVIDILDRGPGLSEEAMARAGELFYSTKAPEGGMGIGLFLANATVERFGGRVSLFNRAEGGCCTRITLPMLAS